MRSRLLAAGMSLPEKVLTNRDLERIVDTSDAWITERTGIKERRIAPEGEPVSTYALASARQALAQAGRSAAEVDLIICGTVTPDMPTPSTACLVQQGLGIPDVTAFDLSAGCTGFLYGLSVADAMLRAGAARRALVIGAEILTSRLNWQDRSTCVIFADGAGAVLLEAAEGDRGVLACRTHSDGSRWDLIQIPGGGSLHPPTAAMVEEKHQYIQMRGNETFKIAVRMLDEVCREVLTAAGVTPDQVDLFIPHQANRRIIDAVGQRLEIDPSRAYINIDRTGNTSSASIPIALAEAQAEGRLEPEKLLLVAAFGAGLTWGAALVRL